MTNKIILFLGLLLFPILSNAQQGINFESGSFEEAFQKAQKENKLLFVDGYAVWCKPCKKMDKTVFKEKEVGDFFNEHFISFKLNVEKGNGPQLKEKYAIEGLPGYVFIDNDDKVVYRTSHAMPTDEFLKEAQLAVDYSKDPNSVGRLHELYTKDKNDEKLARNYLDNLLSQAKAKSYIDVLENYLTIQRNVPESSKEMVLLLARHYEQIVYGGEADRIISSNIRTDEWKKYVRKDIREVYQKLPKKMVETTTEYAIQKQDTTILELTLKNAENIGLRVDDEQRKRTYTYYYFKTGQGEKYKPMVQDGINAFVASLDKEFLRKNYLKWLKDTAAGDPEALRIRPFSVRESNRIYQSAKSFAPFVNTEKETEEVLNWITVAYYIRPSSAESMNDYADILYVIGKKEEAVKVKEEAYKAAQKEKLKTITLIKRNLDLMKAGEKISL
ncbi:thioredoxin family protein [Tenacibaculum aestuarii]|uniref:thioredoxin family protein n=1 Tax=Tenacibaculum aestuarii TaxID=362781 RepID=UPI003894B9F8